MVVDAVAETSVIHLDVSHCRQSNQGSQQRTCCRSCTSFGARRYLLVHFRKPANISTQARPTREMTLTLMNSDMHDSARLEQQRNEPHPPSFPLRCTEVNVEGWSKLRHQRQRGQFQVLRCLAREAWGERTVHGDDDHITQTQKAGSERIVISSEQSLIHT